MPKIVDTPTTAGQHFMQINLCLHIIRDDDRLFKDFSDPEHLCVVYLKRHKHHFLLYCSLAFPENLCKTLHYKYQWIHNVDNEKIA